MELYLFNSTYRISQDKRDGAFILEKARNKNHNLSKNLEKNHL